MLLTDARRESRFAGGELVPLRRAGPRRLGPRRWSPRATTWSASAWPGPGDRAPAGPLPAAGGGQRRAHRRPDVRATPTGARSRRSTTSSPPSTPRRWSRSTGPSRSPSSTGRRSALAEVDRLAARRLPRLARHPRRPAAPARPVGRGPRGVRRGDRRDRQPRRAGLPRAPPRPAGRGEAAREARRSAGRVPGRGRPHRQHRSGCSAVGIAPQTGTARAASRRRRPARPWQAARRSRGAVDRRHRSPASATVPSAISSATLTTSSAT